MIYGIDNKAKNNLQIPISAYANQLTWYLEWYLKKMQLDTESFSIKATEKAKRYFRWIVFPNNKEFEKDFKKIKDDMHTKTWNVISYYTKCIMQLLGQVAECVIVDRCANNSEINKTCINIAMFKENVFKDYDDIDYNDYLAFSTSFKYIIYKDSKTGIYQQYNVPDYNPDHTSKDIAWCKKDNILSQLKAKIDKVGYLENAKLQIKTTLNYNNLALDKYFLTPVICFDLGNDCNNLKQKYPKNIIYSAREICPEMYLEIDKYFRILAAFATQLIDHIDITDIEVQQDFRLAELFRTPIMTLVNGKESNLAGILEMAEEYKRPVMING